VYKILTAMLLLSLPFYINAQGADPTKPLSHVNATGIETLKKGLTLETIIYSSKNKSAVISGKLMKVGDYIGEHELIIVNASNVVLRSGDERLKLSMFSPIISK